MNLEQARKEFEEATNEWHAISIKHRAALEKKRLAKEKYLELKGPKRYRPRPRLDALARGEKTYQAINPCGRCGITGLRYTQGKICVHCARHRKREYIQKKKAEKVEMEIKRKLMLNDSCPLAKVWG